MTNTISTDFVEGHIKRCSECFDGSKHYAAMEQKNQKRYTWAAELATSFSETVSFKANDIIKKVKKVADIGQYKLSKPIFVSTDLRDPEESEQWVFFAVKHIIEDQFKIKMTYISSLSHTFKYSDIYEITWDRKSTLVNLMPEKEYAAPSYIESRKVFLRSRFQDRKYHDITFIVEDKLVNTHKILLAECPYFDTFFSKNWVKNDCNGPIPFSKCRHEVFVKFLEYLYTGEICEEYFSQSKNCLEMFLFANFLQYEPLQKLSRFYLFKQRSKKDFLSIAITAMNHDLLIGGLETYCKRFLEVHKFFAREIDLSQLPVSDIVSTFKIGKQLNNKPLVEVSIAELKKRIAEGHLLQFQECCQNKNDKNLEELFISCSSLVGCMANAGMQSKPTED